MTVRGNWIGDVAIALGLALALGAAWAVKDWDALSRLRLPDTDDAMRLQQVRDWLGGQRWSDLTQHRLGRGLPMHWTRLADLGPAALILAFTPFLGRHAAEVAAVTVWPPLLFAAAILLVVRIARAADGAADARTAGVLASVAYPATTLFMPGRIDHHGLQVVLLLGAVILLLGPAAHGRNAGAGLLAAASLVVGLETAPMLAVLGAGLVVFRIRDGDARLGGFALGGAAGLLAARAVFAPDAFAWPACDGFTESAWLAALAGCAGAGSLASLPLATRGARAAAAGVVAAAVLAAALAVSPGCADPYGVVDPRLAQLWLSGVGEAQSALAASPAVAIGYLGPLAVGVAASALLAARNDARALLFATAAASLALAFLQLRGVYAGVMLAAPALAHAVGAARRRGAMPLVGAWCASAGMLHPIAAQAALPDRAAGPPDCASQAAIDKLSRYPAGTVMAPIDAGAWVLAGTPHRVVGAPYHRIGPGGLAVYDFYRGRAPGRVAQAWRLDYILSCPGMRTPAARLPGWRPAARLDRETTLWVRARLSRTGAAG